jgi:hypothetical protein
MDKIGAEAIGDGARTRLWPTDRPEQF